MGGLSNEVSGYKRELLREMRPVLGKEKVGQM